MDDEKKADEIERGWDQIREDELEEEIRNETALLELEQLLYKINTNKLSSLSANPESDGE